MQFTTICTRTCRFHELVTSSIANVNIRRKFGTVAYSQHVDVGQEIREALLTRKPVVALESTVITHGMPYPANFETALKLEAILRKKLCFPATIAVLDGRVCVGLSTEQLERLCRSKDLLKISRRDIAAAMANKFSGGTTVSGTVFCAHLAGIHLLATGGIGGVHRGVADSLDISADLRELGKTPVGVVCAGVKSLLDIPKTLEYLETEGVPVVSFSNTSDFPNFFTPSSGLHSPYFTQDVRIIAQIVRNQVQLNSGGAVIAVPIPGHDRDSGALIQAAIETALEEVRVKGILGRNVTPYVLERVNQLTEGLSLRLNRILIENNASVAADIAVALAESKPDSQQESPVKRSVITQKRPSVVVVGGSMVDFYVQAHENVSFEGGTYAGKISQSIGGVARNHADALTRLGTKTLLISAIGSDAMGACFTESCSHMDLRGVKPVISAQTGTYMGFINQDKMLSFGVLDAAVHSEVTPALVSEFKDDISLADMVVMDGNIPLATMTYVAQLCLQYKVPLWYEPTDTRKMRKIFDANAWYAVTHCSPNFNEFNVLLECLKMPPISLERRREYMEHLLQTTEASNLKVLIVTEGPNGVQIHTRNTTGGVDHDFVSAPTKPGDNVVSPSGAGDCFNAGFIHAQLAGLPWSSVKKLAQATARMSLLSADPVPKSLGDIVRQL